MNFTRSRLLYRRTCRCALPASSFLACLILWVARATAGLIITPTYGANLNTDSNSTAIKAVINQAIANYEAKFSDPINVPIRFQEMTTGLGSSSYWYYNIPYSQFITTLTADKKTSDDTTALAHLPPGATNPINGNSSINLKTANLRAIGINGLNSGLSGGVDGIISLNTHVTDVGSSGTTGQYNLLAVVEHEVDEILGLGSALSSGLSGNDPLPEDLFRFTSGGARSYVTTGDDAYFSIDGGATDLVRFNQGNNAGGDYGDWWSGNGTGNAGPTPPTRVQDAFIFPNRQPTLGAELRALDVIGYDLVPEPGTIALAAVGIGCLAIATGRKAARRRGIG